MTNNDILSCFDVNSRIVEPPPEYIKIIEEAKEIENKGYKVMVTYHDVLGHLVFHIFIPDKPNAEWIQELESDLRYEFGYERAPHLVACGEIKDIVSAFCNQDIFIKYMHDSIRVCCSESSFLSDEIYYGGQYFQEIIKGITERMGTDYISDTIPKVTKKLLEQEQKYRNTDIEKYLELTDQLKRNGVNYVDFEIFLNRAIKRRLDFDKKTRINGGHHSKKEWRRLKIPFNKTELSYFKYFIEVVLPYIVNNDIKVIVGIDGSGRPPTLAIIKAFNLKYPELEFPKVFFINPRIIIEYGVNVSKKIYLKQHKYLCKIIRETDEPILIIDDQVHYSTVINSVTNLFHKIAGRRKRKGLFFALRQRKGLFFTEFVPYFSTQIAAVSWLRKPNLVGFQKPSEEKLSAHYKIFRESTSSTKTKSRDFRKKMYGHVQKIVRNI
jgi:hypothetical protein